MKAKKYFLSVLLGAMCVGFVACDNAEPEVKPDGTTTETTLPDNSDDSGTLPPENPDSTETTTPTEPDVPKHNVELEFWRNELSQIHMDTVQKYLNDKYVDSIFLVLDKGSTFSSSSQNNINIYRTTLQKRTDLSPRVRGRGDFVFHPAGTVLPDDSLYFVSKGWTVNKFFNNQ